MSCKIAPWGIKFVFYTHLLRKSIALVVHDRTQRILLVKLCASHDSSTDCSCLVFLLSNNGINKCIVLVVTADHESVFGNRVQVYMLYLYIRTATVVEDTVSSGPDQLIMHMRSTQNTLPWASPLRHHCLLTLYDHHRCTHLPVNQRWIFRASRFLLQTKRFDTSSHVGTVWMARQGWLRSAFSGINKTKLKARLAATSA